MENEVIDLSLIDSAKNNQIYDTTYHIIEKLKLTEQTSHIINSLVLLSITVIALLAIDWLTRRFLLAISTKFILKTKTQVDDFLVNNKVLEKYDKLLEFIMST